MLFKERKLMPSSPHPLLQGGEEISLINPHPALSPPEADKLFKERKLMPSSPHPLLQGGEE